MIQTKHDNLLDT